MTLILHKEVRSFEIYVVLTDLFGVNDVSEALDVR